MFFIAAGNVEVTSNQQTPIRLGPGDFFGELALLTQETRNADVIAVGYCELLVLPKQDFYLLLETQPTLKTRLSPREDGKQS